MVVTSVSHLFCPVYVLNGFVIVQYEILWIFGGVVRGCLLLSPTIIAKFLPIPAESVINPRLVHFWTVSHWIDFRKKHAIIQCCSIVDSLSQYDPDYVKTHAGLVIDLTLWISCQMSVTYHFRTTSITNVWQGVMGANTIIFEVLYMQKCGG